MKKELSGILLLIFAIGSVSAATLGDLLNQIDTQTLILYAVFIVSFSVLFLALSRFFKDNKSIAGIISAVIAFLFTYFVNKSGFDIQVYLYDIGISTDVLSTIVPIIILAGVVFTIIKLKGASLFVFGGVLIAVSFFVYAQELLLIVGAILIVIGFVILGKKKKS